MHLASLTERPQYPVRAVELISAVARAIFHCSQALNESWCRLLLSKVVTCEGVLKFFVL